jgi:hypothetical protein
MEKTVKEIADSVAACGLICAYCIRFVNGECKGCRMSGHVCPILDCCKERVVRGCWACEDYPCCECSFRSSRTKAFLQCAKEDGILKLAEHLHRNNADGLRYHYDGSFQGDYDECKNVEEVLQLLRKGKKEE